MKKIKRILLLLAMTLLVSGMCIVSFAASGTSETKVVFDGSDDSFSAGYENQWSGNDLFREFKNVMPGDVITQKIEVSCTNIEGNYVNIYIRGLGAVEGDEEFLSKIRMEVTAEGESTLYEGSSDRKWGFSSKKEEGKYEYSESDGKDPYLKDWTYLGTFYNNTTQDIIATIHVPETLTQEYDAGKLKWQFKADKLPIKSDDSHPVRTGDIVMAGKWVAILLICAVAVFVLIRAKRKKEE